MEAEMTVEELMDYLREKEGDFIVRVSWEEDKIGSQG